jgi:ADP-ribose pyrophosphatase YjhB (NUDIX family)
VARAFVLNGEQAILLVTHDPGRYWYTPGGHVAPGETLLDCAQREVLEETGLWVDVGRLVLVDELIDPELGERKLECYFLASTPATAIGPSWRDRGGPVKQARFFQQAELARLPAVFPTVLQDEFWERLADNFSGHNPYRNLLEHRP